jgi:hypothetical protein
LEYLKSSRDSSIPDDADLFTDSNKDVANYLGDRNITGTKGVIYAKRSEAKLKSCRVVG